jgi:predicted ester cyclase
MSSADERADAIWRGESTSDSQSRAAEHRELFTRWFEEIWNKKNYDIAYELVHPDFTAHGAGGQDIKQGPDGVIGMIKAWHAAMPDGKMTVDDIITEGDMSTIRMTWRATHSGPFGDVPASGKPIEVTSIGIDRVIDGKITEGWGELNLLGMLMQMGAIPAPPPPPDPVTPERLKAAIYRFYDEANKGNLDIFNEVVAENFYSHGLGGRGEVHGREQFKEVTRAFMSAFPDLHFQVQHLIVDGKMVAVRGIQTATHKGNFMGMAEPTGKKVTWTGTAIFRFNDHGMAEEHWHNMDEMGLMQQLGVIPGAGGESHG